VKFYECPTWFQMMKQMSPEQYKRNKVSWQDFYKDQIFEAIRSQGKESWQGLLSAPNLMAESQWLRLGKPYYKIWPGVFDPFIATRMDISTDFLRPPHKAFAILFPDIEEPLLSFQMASGLWEIRSILVEHFSAEEVEETKGDGISTPLDKIFPHSKHKDQKRGVLKVRLDFINKDPNNPYITSAEPEMQDLLRKINVPSIFIRNIEITPHMTIEKAIGEFVDVEPEDDSIFGEKDAVPASIVEACFRLVVGICFVSTGSQKVLERDVLSKHLNAYRERMAEGDTKKCKEIERKAKDKGKFGWNVGIDRHGRHLVLPKGVTYEDAVNKAGGRHLLYQHERGAHWHLYWTGEGRKTPVVKWVEETTVRSDLPVKPIA